MLFHAFVFSKRNYNMSDGIPSRYVWYCNHLRTNKARDNIVTIGAELNFTHGMVF